MFARARPQSRSPQREAAARPPSDAAMNRAAGESAIGEPPAWAWSLDTWASVQPSTLEEGWTYLRRVFVVCFSGAQHISSSDLHALCGTTAALVDAGQVDEIDRRVQVQLRETMRRSAAGIDRHLPGPQLRVVVLARWVQLKAWSTLWERVFGRFLEIGVSVVLDEFTRAVTARLQPSGLARARLRYMACLPSSDLAFEEVVSAAGSKPAARMLLDSFEVQWQGAEHELRRRLARWRRIAPLVGRWRRFLILLHDTVHFRPANPGQKRCQDEFEALAAGTVDDSVEVLVQGGNPEQRRQRLH